MPRLIGRGGWWVGWGLGLWLLTMGWPGGGARPVAQAAPDKSYVGAKACQECHPEQYESFSKHSKKAHSYQSVKTMRKGLTEREYLECLGCHSTGYGQPGGFRSEQETPDLANAGCETCHGPGSAHVESQDPKDIGRKLQVKDCERCHNAERVGAFRFKPLLFGGAH